MVSDKRKSFMKIELDDEVDRILRARMKRRPAERALSDAPTDAHLDADALSLYVEQALTPALRAAYTRHLIACGACREQVAMLARLIDVTDETNVAAQSVAAQTITSQSAASQTVAVSDGEANAPRVENAAGTALPRASVWERFTHYFFAPRALAFALPALALVILSATIFLLTSRPETDSTSLVAVSQPVTMNANMNMSANMNGNASEVYAATERGLMNANGNFNPSHVSPDAKQKGGAVSNSQESARTTSVANESARSPVAPSETLSPAPPPPPSPGQSPNSAPGVAARIETQSSATARKESDARRDDEEAVSIADTDEAKVARNNTIREAEQSRAARVAPAPVKRSADSANATSTMSQPGAMPGDSASRARRAVGGSVTDKPLVTRTVGGKRFSRRGAVWVDEIYVAGSALTDVRRNSTQYRALLNAEPALRATIEALGGEVIIVAKNRAYRIR